MPGITPNWTAPEIIEGRAGPSTYSDCYSLGLVLWEVFTFEEPFPTLNAREIAVAVCEHGIRPPIPPSVPTQVRDVHVYLGSLCPSKHKNQRLSCLTSFSSTSNFHHACARVGTQYAKVVEQLWSKHAHDRPKAEDVVNTIAEFSKQLAENERQQLANVSSDYLERDIFFL